MPGATAKEIAAETGYSEITILRHARRLNMNMRPAWPDHTEYDEAWLRVTLRGLAEFSQPAQRARVRADAGGGAETTRPPASRRATLAEAS